MLVYEPSRRITARDAMLHPYFSDLDKTSVPATGEEYVANAGGVYQNMSDTENIERVYQVHPKTVELGSDSLPTAKFLSGAAKDDVAPMDVSTHPAAPLADNQEVNMSIT
ncbi:unnamed protein product [Dicrocoelium dendriticum]|nr:unnamed protein product [Dicrocoelium dendriticum]